MSRPRVVKVHMDGRDILATVARVALDPTCASCGGPCALRPGPHASLDLHVQHRDGCQIALEEQNRRSEA